jgi:hypothetical protein
LKRRLTVKLVSGSHDTEIRVWSIDTWACGCYLEYCNAIGHYEGVICLVMHGGTLLSSSNDHTIKVWSTGTWACEYTPEGHNGAVNCLAVHTREHSKSILTARRDRGAGRVCPVIFLFLCRKKRNLPFLLGRAFCTLAARLWQVHAGARARRRREVNQGAL